MHMELTHTLETLSAGAQRVPVVIQARQLLAAGLTWEAIGDSLGVPFPTLWKWVKRAGDLPDDALRAEVFAPRRAAKKLSQRRADLPQVCGLTPDEVRIVRETALIVNRADGATSLPEACRQAAKLGGIRPEVVALWNQREAEGKPLLTAAQRQAIALPEVAIHASRHPRDAWLNFVESPGCTMFCTDPNGEQRYIRAGEQWTMDDGTPNFIACVPTGDPRWPFGVMPGRFQFLLIVDHRSYYIPGFSYTARPKGSYRAEDLVSTLDNTIREHGAPYKIVLEKGISAAEAVTRALTLAGIRIIRANSPHQKVVEFVFNNLWTKLSLTPAQVGRTRGEEERVTALLESCRRGATDPRKHFLMLAEVIQALKTAIQEWNDHPINGSRWGQWVPRELWQRESPANLRPLPPQDAWMFAPHVTDELLVRKYTIATSVLMMPGYSQQYTFSSDWLGEWMGARIRLHFNPFAPDSIATAVLAAPFRDARAGLVLGQLDMVDTQARWTKRAWGYSDQPDEGRAAARRNSQALHRTAVSIRPDGKPGVVAVEARDGEGKAASIQTGSAPADRRAAPAKLSARDLSAFDPAELSSEDAPAATPRRASLEAFDPAELSDFAPEPPRRSGSLEAFDPAELAEV